MSHGKKYKWMLILLIWSGCFLLCFFNVETINSILDSREKEEILQRDMVFWKQNEDNISGVIERQSLFSHDIESLKLGIVFLDDTFNRLGTDFNLTELKVEMDSRQSLGDSMPVRVSFRGKLQDGLDAIKRIQSKYIFLSFSSLKVEEGKQGSSADFEMLLDYKYNLAGI